MGSGSKFARVGIGAAVLGVLAIGHSASAAGNNIELMRDVVRYTVGAGGEFGVRATNFTGMVPPPMGPGVAGPQSLFQTFCMEEDESVSTHDNFNSDIEYNGPHYLYTWTLDVAVQAGGRNTDSGDPISPQTAYLYTQFYNGTLGGYVYAFGAGRVASAAALQESFWFFENELGTAADGYSPPVSSLSAPAQAFVAAANAAVAGSWGNTIGNVRVLNLVADDGVTLGQSVLVMTAPPPPTGGSAYSPGYWHKESRFTGVNPNLYPYLSGLCLFNADGSDFDPTTGAQVAGWIQSNATNMAYKLSTMTCCGLLNTLVPVGGKTYDPNTLVKTGAASVYFGGAAKVKFGVLLQAAIDDLCLPGHNYTPSQGAGSQYRAKQAALAAALDAIWV